MPDVISIHAQAVALLVEKLQTEGLIDMREAARHYANGTHKATPIRYATRGIVVRGRRMKLEAVMIGGKLCTSKPALLRFFAAQNAEPDAAPASPSPSPAARTRANSKVEAELDALGVC